MKDPTRSFPAIARRVGLLILLAVVLPAAGVATEVRTTIAPGEDPGLNDLPTDATSLGLTRVEDTTELSLEDAISLSLKRNISLVVERYRRAQTLQGVEEAFGIYDFNLGGFFRLSEDTRPISSTLEIADVDITAEFNILNFNLSQLTKVGGTASLAFNNSRLESSNQTVQPNPQFGSSLDLTYTQPLLRNFGRAVTETNIRVARNNSAISRETFKNQVEAIVQQVADRYWLLVEAREQLKVSEESLSLAKKLHGMNRIQVEVGTMAPLEMLQSEAGVATREEEIIRRQADVENSTDILRRLLNLDRVEFWDVTIIPVTDPVIPYVEIDFDEAYKTALENRPDLVSQRLVNDNRELAAGFARNQIKPQLNVSVGLSFDGVGGDFNFTDPVSDESVSIPGGYSDALDQIVGRDFRSWFVQAVFAYPLQNRTAKARSARAELAVEQSVYELRDLEQQVLLGVRTFARAVRTAEQQIESGKVSTKLQRKNVEAEQKRYENGLATSFQVLQTQEDLTEALSREVSAITNYRRALNALYYSTGEILDSVGVELVE